MPKIELNLQASPGSEWVRCLQPGFSFFSLNLQKSFCCDCVVCLQAVGITSLTVRSIVHITFHFYVASPQTFICEKREWERRLIY